jgi:hypothetical protein
MIEGAARQLRRAVFSSNRCDFAGSAFSMRYVVPGLFRRFSSLCSGRFPADTHMPSDRQPGISAARSSNVFAVCGDLRSREDRGRPVSMMHCSG